MSETESEKEAQGTGPKVLRIGIIQNGKIIEERRLKKRETVSVGQNPKCSFVVTAPTMPKSFDLFEFTGSEYYLRYTDDMDGRIQLTGEAVSDFKALQSLSVKRGGNAAIKLSEASRGKVMIGDVTVLFQFVPPPPLVGKGELPPEARGTILSTIDVQFTTIFVAVSIFLAVFAQWARSIPYAEPTMQTIDERIRTMISPNYVPEPIVEEKPTDDGGDKSKEEEEKKPDPKPAASGKKTPSGPKSVDKSKAVASKGLLQAIGAKGKGGGALNDVFSDDFGGDVGSALQGVSGIGMADSGNTKGTRGGGNGQSASIGDLDTGGGGEADIGSKNEAKVGNIKSEAPSVDGEIDSELLNRELKTRVKALKACYEAQLKRFPTLAGKLVMDFEIKESGAVADIQFKSDTLGNSQVNSCIVQRARLWRFPKPKGGSVFVTFPVVFSPAN